MGLKGGSNIMMQSIIRQAQNMAQKFANFEGMSAEKVSQIFEQKDDFDMENSTLEFDIYHFKVMELTTLEDTGRLNECKVRFHFYHRLIKKKNE